MSPPAGETRAKQIYCNVVFVLCGPNRPKWLIQKLPGLSVDTLSIHHIDYVIRVDDCLQAKSIVSAKYSHSSPTHMNGVSYSGQSGILGSVAAHNLAWIYTQTYNTHLKQVSLCVGVNIFHHIKMSNTTQS